MVAPFAANQPLYMGNDLDLDGTYGGAECCQGSTTVKCGATHRAWGDKKSRITERRSSLLERIFTLVN